MAQRNSEQVQKFAELDVGALVVSTATGFVKKRPVTVSVWVLGLLLAAFANGFAVSELQEESYSIALGNAQEVDQKELSKALANLRRAEDKHYSVKGWFWSCDDRCMAAKDKVAMAQSEVARVQEKRDMFLREARREVGIWSVFGIRDIRSSFWRAWQAGKDMAARWTMFDAMFVMFNSREESMMSTVLQLVLQYIMNLTVGLVGACFYFAYNVYTLIVSYGEPALSGIAFFLLVMVAGVSLVGTYLMAIYGTVAGGGLFLVKQAAKTAALEGNVAAEALPDVSSTASTTSESDVFECGVGIQRGVVQHVQRPFALQTRA
eukprot:CAMPEP_0183387120 /NCGR_PEP_ID=MMETSP0370-20130417/2919_1 /TAXON_ID=268820 /ORGANISM="Peridinium aciculiferum, Strain PAER-2" /LENGTH=319 /DNA_ID=CAMNT_0025565611 /DNA_START=92 /DNA_END=1049 /DNA_ORIENTATION=+